MNSDFSKLCYRDNTAKTKAKKQNAAGTKLLIIFMVPDLTALQYFQQKPQADSKTDVLKLQILLILKYCSSVLLSSVSLAEMLTVVALSCDHLLVKYNSVEVQTVYNKDPDRTCPFCPILEKQECGAYF